MKRVDRGFVFLNGQYLSPPYDVECAATHVRLNGHDLTVDAHHLLKKYERDIEDHLYASHSDDPGQIALTSLFFDLHMEGVTEVTVLQEGREPLFLETTREGQDLLRILCGHDIQAPHVDSGPDKLNPVSERESWIRLVTEFEASPEFLDRAQQHLQQIDSVQHSNDQISQANVWADRVKYPLTTFAMFIVVYAFGHLLSHKPKIEAPDPDGLVSTETRQVVLRSLLLVGLLSVLDLTWTIAAAQAGSMRELNPLGSQIINDPLRLILYKSVLTLTAIGLLYRLHQNPIAQAASWWSCLVLTLLTARWLTFNSMFL